MAIDGIPKTMLAAQVIEYNQPYKIDQIPTPQALGPHDLLLKVAAASYCHTDKMVMEGIVGTELPCVGSHEGAGTVVAVGDRVTDFHPGDRVMAGIPYGLCGTCVDCQGPESERHYCSYSGGFVGLTRNGTFAEYMVADARASVVLPSGGGGGGVEFATAAPLACAGSTAFRAVRTAELAAGDTLAIVGAGGGVGHLAIQFAKARGLRVIALDASDGGLALARSVGADAVIDVRSAAAGGSAIGSKEHTEAIVRQVRAATDPAGEADPNGGAHASITITEAAGASALACAITRKHGTMVQIAQPDEVKIPYQEFIFRDIRVRSSMVASRAESAAMLDAVARHGIRVQTTPFAGLRSLPTLLDQVRTRTLVGKGVVIVDEAQAERTG